MQRNAPSFHRFLLLYCFAHVCRPLPRSTQLAWIHSRSGTEPEASPDSLKTLTVARVAILEGSLEGGEGKSTGANLELREGTFRSEFSELEIGQTWRSSVR